MQISLGDAIKEFLKNSRLKGGVQALQIKEVWETLMGKTIANYTEDIRIIDRKLFITTHVAPLKNELVYQKQKIIERINEHFHENIIDEVVVK